MEHVLACHRAFNIKIVDLDRYSFHFVRQNVLRDEPMVAMALNLQLKLIEVDALEV